MILIIHYLPHSYIHTDRTNVVVSTFYVSFHPTNLVDYVLIHQLQNHCTYYTISSLQSAQTQWSSSI
jgi:hypothetical protein